MKDTIEFTVTKEQGVYTAKCVDLPVVAEGNTRGELEIHLSKALDLYFEDKDAASLGFCTSPKIRSIQEITPAELMEELASWDEEDRKSIAKAAGEFIARPAGTYSSPDGERAVIRLLPATDEFSGERDIPERN
jgi:hypothetical protein